jgi:aryl-alcohol dehydrogenase-like predicted oxidoreductase
MEYRFLGRTGVRVSRICFGTASFGPEIDEQDFAAVFHRCRDAGINFFDTSNAYYAGHSEEVLGTLIGGCRNEIVLSSKVAIPTGADVNARGLSRRHIMLAIENSLKRLRTDRLDLYYMHQFDSNASIELTLRALDDLVQQGKIVYPAVSNWAAWQIATALGISAREGLARFECVQPMYNLVKRQAEVEILPLAQAERLGVAVYSPLGGGLLTGKYDTTHRPADGKLAWDPQFAARYGEAVCFETAERLTAHAKQQGVHPGALAIAWVVSHPAVTAAIIGARNVAQLEDSLGALEVHMTPEWRDKISALSVEPPVATDRRDEKFGFFDLPRV